MFPKGKRIPLFLALVALFWFSLYTYSPIFTVYIKEFSTTQMAGTIIASYGFVQMCLRIPVGILSDKIKKSKDLHHDRPCRKRRQRTWPRAVQGARSGACVPRTYGIDRRDVGPVLDPVFQLL